MGDRANIAVIQNQDRSDQIWLYSHWGGSGMWRSLQAGLTAGKPRWNDEQYLTRIIHEHTIEEGEFRSETGHGISCRIGDNEYPVLVVDVPKAYVFVIGEQELKNGKVPKEYNPKGSVLIC